MRLNHLKRKKSTIIQKFIKVLISAIGQGQTLFLWVVEDMCEYTSKPTPTYLLPKCLERIKKNILQKSIGVRHIHVSLSNWKYDIATQSLINMYIGSKQEV
jgi:hypothetical protein